MRMRSRKQVAKGFVVRPVDRLYPMKRFREREAVTINFKPVSDDSRNSSQSAAYARRLRIHVGRKRFNVHFWVEFEWFSININICARKIGAQHRRAKVYTLCEELINEAIFGTPKRLCGQP